MKTNRLMLFREIIYTCSEGRMKPHSRLCEANWGVVMWEQELRRPVAIIVLSGLRSFICCVYSRDGIWNCWANCVNQGPHSWLKNWYSWFVFEMSWLTSVPTSSMIVLFPCSEGGMKMAWVTPKRVAVLVLFEVSSVVWRLQLCLLKRNEVTHLKLAHLNGPLVYSSTSFVVHYLLIILSFSAVYWRRSAHCFCTHQIFGWSNQEEWEGRRQVALGSERSGACTQGFGGETWGKATTLKTHA
jgi:hypothetical protein